MVHQAQVNEQHGLQQSESQKLITHPDALHDIHFYSLTTQHDKTDTFEIWMP
jgi:hypothetical protein